MREQWVHVCEVHGYTLRKTPQPLHCLRKQRCLCKRVSPALGEGPRSQTRWRGKEASQATHMQRAQLALPQGMATLKWLPLEAFEVIRQTTAGHPHMRGARREEWAEREAQAHRLGSGRQSSVG